MIVLNELIIIILISIGLIISVILTIVIGLIFGFDIYKGVVIFGILTVIYVTATIIIIYIINNVNGVASLVNPKSGLGRTCRDDSDCSIFSNPYAPSDEPSNRDSFFCDATSKTCKLTPGSVCNSSPECSQLASSCRIENGSNLTRCMAISGAFGTIGNPPTTLLDKTSTTPCVGDGLVQYDQKTNYTVCYLVEVPSTYSDPAFYDCDTTGNYCLVGLCKNLPAANGNLCVKTDLGTGCIYHRDNIFMDECGGSSGNHCSPGLETTNPNDGLCQPLNIDTDNPGSYCNTIFPCIGESQCLPLGTSGKNICTSSAVILDFCSIDSVKCPQGATCSQNLGVCISTVDHNCNTDEDCPLISSCNNLTRTCTYPSNFPADINTNLNLCKNNTQTNRDALIFLKINDTGYFDWGILAEHYRFEMGPHPYCNINFNNDPNPLFLNYQNDGFNFFTAITNIPEILNNSGVSIDKNNKYFSSVDVKTDNTLILIVSSITSDEHNEFVTIHYTPFLTTMSNNLSLMLKSYYSSGCDFNFFIQLSPGVDSPFLINTFFVYSNIYLILYFYTVDGGGINHLSQLKFGRIILSPPNNLYGEYNDSNSNDSGYEIDYVGPPTIPDGNSLIKINKKGIVIYNVDNSPKYVFIFVCQSFLYNPQNFGTPTVSRTYTSWINIDISNSNNITADKIFISNISETSDDNFILPILGIPDNGVLCIINSIDINLCTFDSTNQKLAPTLVPIVNVIFPSKLIIFDLVADQIISSQGSEGHEFDGDFEVKITFQGIYNNISGIYLALLSVTGGIRPTILKKYTFTVISIISTYNILNHIDTVDGTSDLDNITMLSSMIGGVPYMIGGNICS